MIRMSAISHSDYKASKTPFTSQKPVKISCIVFEKTFRKGGQDLTMDSYFLFPLCLSTKVLGGDPSIFRNAV